MIARRFCTQHLFKMAYSAAIGNGLMSSTPSLISRQELIGDVKVNVTHGPVIMKDIARGIADANKAEGNFNAFIVANLDALHSQLQVWRKELPRVQQLYYAVKCNNDALIVKILADLGLGFDVASREEIDMILNMGISADRIIYSNPNKQHSIIDHAYQTGVNLTVFGTKEELMKIVKHHSKPEVMMRIEFSDPPTNIRRKNGVNPIKKGPELLQFASEMGVNVCGVSFHLRGGGDPAIYRLALQYVRDMFDAGKRLGHNMTIVNIGGGFSGGENGLPFDKAAAALRQYIDDLFPDPNVRIVAEPGQFFATSTCSLVANVIAASEVPADYITGNEADSGSIGYNYCINDGLYFTFSYFQHGHGQMISGVPLEDKDGEEYPSTIWGHTCDSRDLIEDKKMMRKLDVDDWIFYKNIGAYSLAASSTFNGFSRPMVNYVISENLFNQLGL